MYKETDLVRIAKRENNTKRSYLVVNRLQGKHIPVCPGEALGMFRALADTLKDDYAEERLLLVGFAETATAIGAAVAVELGTEYIQTTREVIEGVDYIFFSEEHSHATEQKLVKDDMDICMETIDRIVFVEDEVTTGKTILNIIDMLEKLYPGKVKYSVASLLNGMDEAALQLYADKDIRLHYLVKTNHGAYSAIAEQFAGDGTYVVCGGKLKAVVECSGAKQEVMSGSSGAKQEVMSGSSGAKQEVMSGSSGAKQEVMSGSSGAKQVMMPGTCEAVRQLRMGAYMDARRLVDATYYKDACEALWIQVEGALLEELSGSVLVLGTEEFMYPALYVANKLEEKGLQVRSHATTRSPIAVSAEPEYPLHVRYELRSLYDKDRVTFVYDIDSYDAVLIITDAHDTQEEGLHSLLRALGQQNEKIVCIRWC